MYTFYIEMHVGKRSLHPVLLISPKKTYLCKPKNITTYTMQPPKDIAIEDFNYPLPDDRIAKFPLANRDESKLLTCIGGEISENTFKNLPDLLPSDTMLIFNNTKVIHARLFFSKDTGALIEIFCLEPYQSAISSTFEQHSHCSWLCFVGNNKKWKSGVISRELTINNEQVTLTATRREAYTNAWVVDFDWTGGISFAEIIEHAGVIPLPPYLHRDAQDSDKERYQTIYAHFQGSVAAPTAGLHFTENIFKQLNAKGIATEFITLHVGAGTFKPVSTDTIGEHIMHVEKIAISRKNLENIRDNCQKFIIPVGTTTVRTLESVYWFGVKLQLNPDEDAMHLAQWESYSLESQAIDTRQAFDNVLAFMQRHQLEVLEGDTQMIIAPGYKFHVIKGIITNFHQPQSTLLLLVSAIIGQRWRDCYQYALDHNFRFLSYGDSCLFIP